MRAQTFCPECSAVTVVADHQHKIYPPVEDGLAFYVVVFLVPSGWSPIAGFAEQYISIYLV